MDAKEYFGARTQTIERWKHLYSKDYFSNVPLSILRKTMYQQEIERLKVHFDFFERGGRVLDIGCGEGKYLSLFGPQWEKYGMEISEHGRSLAQKEGIITDFKVQDNFFDLIIFRGTIQHIPDPTTRIEESYYWLKKDGGIAFLSTPNANSIVYKLFNTLPMLSPKYNFFIPSDFVLGQILENFGFTDIKFEYPYIGTSYANPPKDMISFMLRLLGLKKQTNFPFFKNMMECYARKRQ